MSCGVQIYGTRAAGRDSRLDFAFPTRAKRASEAIRAKKEAAEQAKNDKLLQEELAEHNERIERSQSRGLEPVSGQLPRGAAEDWEADRIRCVHYRRRKSSTSSCLTLS